MKAVIDTNVLLVASGRHAEVSPECVATCIERLDAIRKSGMVVIDDGWRIIEEYTHRNKANAGKGVGDVFLKWLLQNLGNTSRVEQVALIETEENRFANFPVPNLEDCFDAPDRKFVAVAHAHPEKPPVWQAADCKWLDWWQELRDAGITVEFLCPDDVCHFYREKFPHHPIPSIPKFEP